jgi:AMMECR1 domain-containing protein
VYSSTYLPEVAKKYGWTKKKTIESLLEKAGYFGDLKSIEGSLFLRRYKSSKYFLSYPDYIKK